MRSYFKLTGCAICLLGLSTIAVSGCSQTAVGKFIPAAHKSIGYEGRIGFTDSCAEIYWTGSNIDVNVKDAKTVRALLADENGDSYYAVILDNDSAGAVKIRIDRKKQFYTLAKNLSGGPHHLRLFKVSNTDYYTTRFYGFEIDADATVAPATAKPKRKIEFFGNSITCGHGAEDGSNNSGKPEFFNNYRAYGAITARHFNSQYHCTAKSGIGITVSWFKEVMPDIYDRLNPKDPASKWDFAKYQPDIVVVNLFQNDSWLVNRPDHPQFKARFDTTKPTEAFLIDAYKKFIQALRHKYPNARIICCLGNMDATMEGSKWPGYIESAVSGLRDKKVVAHFFPYKKTPGHPVIKEQAAMAADLIAFIGKGHYW